MRTIFAVAVTAALGAVLALAQAPEVRLKAAQNKEQVEGDLKGAIEQYKKLAQSGNRALAAKALVQMGQCYEKLGDTEARKAYERVVANYADQREVADQARARLASLGPVSTSKPAMTMRKLPLSDLASISDDGRYGSSTDWDTGNVAVVNMATSETHNLTQYGKWDDSKGYVDETAISRDGKQIAFWHYYFGPTNGSLRVIGADGRGERVLCRAKAGETWGRPTDWSPDGKYIAVQLYRGMPGGVRDIGLISAADGSVRVLKTISENTGPKMMFSPDGQYIAYDYPAQKENPRNRIIVITAADGNRESLIAPQPALDSFLGWMPDGSILFASASAGSPGIWRVKVAEGKQAGEPELVKSNFSVRSIGITRNGTFHYTTSASISKAYTAAIDPQTGKMIAPPAPVTRRTIYSSSAPAWSADGQRLAYISRRGDAGPSLLSIQSPDGSERDVLPRSGLDLLRWHPDGQSLLAVGAAGGLFQIDPRTGEAKLVVPAGPGRQVSEWSSDGKWAFISKGGKEIVRKDIASGQEKILYTGHAMRDFRLSPDGQRLAFIEYPGPPEKRSSLLVMSTEGDSPHRLATTSDDVWFPRGGTVWTPDGRYILLAMQQREGPRDAELWILPTDGGEARKSDLVIKGGRLGDLSVHPDGKRIAYSVTTNKTEIWALENFLPKAAK